MSTVTKKDLASQLRDKIPLTKKMSEDIIRTVSSDIANSLCGGNKVEMRGLGVLDVIVRKASKGYDFARKESIDTPSKSVVKFRASAGLKERLNS